MPATCDSMTRRPHPNHRQLLRQKLRSLRSEASRHLLELSKPFDLHASHIKQWKDHRPEGTTGVFADETKADSPAPTADVKTRYAKVGALTLENVF